MDGRIKILLTIAYIVLIFISKNAASLILTALVLIGIILISKVPFRMYIRNIKPILPIIILTSVLNALYVSGGKLLINFWIIHIYSSGIIAAVYMSARITLLIMCSTVMTYTTTPTNLTDSIEKLLSPLKYLKIDIHSLALMMSIALRFVPTLIDETDKIMSAQKSRGADIESGGLMSRIKSLIPILVPLLISSFRRAAELADAMECRCYHGGEGRTRLKVMKLSSVDYIAMAFFAVFLVLLILSVNFLDGAIYRLMLMIISFFKGII